MTSAIREKRKVRTTKAEVRLIDSHHPDAVSIVGREKTPRWLLACEAHGKKARFSTHRLAREELGHPERWCEGCVLVEGEPTEDPMPPPTPEEEKAAEFALAQERREAEKERVEKLVAEWKAFAVDAPKGFESVLLPPEREFFEKLVAERDELRKEEKAARAGANQGADRLADLPAVKSRREQKNLDRLVAEVESLREKAREKGEEASRADAEVARLSRIGYVRALLDRGYRVVRKDGRRTVVPPRKTDPVAIFPANYLPQEDFVRAYVGKESWPRTAY